MDFQFSEEQKLLADSLEGWLRKEYSFDHWRKLVKTDLGYKAENWRYFADMGWLSVSLPDDVGGLGGGMIETGIIAERFGAAMVSEPYLSTVVIGAGFVSAAASGDLKDEWLPSVGEGMLKFAFAHAEHGSRFALNEVSTKAVKSDSSWLLSGRKIVVWDAPSADKLIVLARTAGGKADAKGLGLFVVDAKAKGIARQDYRTVDARRASDIVFENTPAEAVLGDRKAPCQSWRRWWIRPSPIWRPRPWAPCRRCTKPRWLM